MKKPEADIHGGKRAASIALLVGPIDSGKTTALRSWYRAVSRRATERQCVRQGRRVVWLWLTRWRTKGDTVPFFVPPSTDRLPFHFAGRSDESFASDAECTWSAACSSIAVAAGPLPLGAMVMPRFDGGGFASAALDDQWHPEDASRAQSLGRNGESKPGEDFPEAVRVGG